MDTETMMGYRKSSMTPKLIPTVAIMKENSPIWPKHRPALTELRRLSPESSMPKPELNDLSRTTTIVMTRICHQYWTNTDGFTIIPTDTKNTAPNRFLIGVVNLWIISASSVSARMEPMMKAPSAEEKPAVLASQTMRKHSPTANTVKVSSVMNFLAHLSIVGTRKTPPTYQTRRKNSSFSTLYKSSWPSKAVDTANVERITIIRIAAMSSTTSTPITLLVNRSPFILRSSKALAMMVVDDMESMAPRKMLSICDHPNNLPSRKPMIPIDINSVRAVMPTVPACFFSFLKLNSKPMANKRNTMPISLQVSTL